MKRDELLSRQVHFTDSPARPGPCDLYHFRRSIRASWFGCSLLICRAFLLRVTSEGTSPCPHPIPPLCKTSIALTNLHRSSTVDSATRSMGKSINNVCRIFETVIWCGSLIIWIRSATTSLSLSPLSSHHRRSAVSNLRAPLPGSVYANSEPYVAPGGYSHHRTRFRLIF